MNNIIVTRLARKLMADNNLKYANKHHTSKQA